MKGGQAHAGDSRFAAAGDNDIGFAASDTAHRFAHGVGGACARRRDREIRAFQFIDDRKVSARRVKHHFRDGEGADAIGPFEKHFFDLHLDFPQSADARTEDHTTAGAVFIRKVDSRIDHCGSTGTEGELGKAIQTLYFLGIGEAADIKIGDIAPEVNFVLRCIERRQIVNPRLAVKQFLPDFVNAVTKWGYQAHASNDDSTLIHLRTDPSVAEQLKEAEWKTAICEAKKMPPRKSGNGIMRMIPRGTRRQPRRTCSLSTKIRDCDENRSKISSRRHPWSLRYSRSLRRPFGSSQPRRREC